MTDLERKIERLQSLLIAIATSGNHQEGKEEYQNLRTELLNDTQIKTYLPDFLSICGTTKEFWRFIQPKISTYDERRNFLQNEFSNVLNYIQTTQNGIIDQSTLKTIKEFSQEHITSEWEEALKRKVDDPKGAITIARTLLESTCKYILDGLGITYAEELGLTKLYKETAKNLNLAPDQHSEEIFKQILGGCQTVVEGLGALRNKVSDAHGRSRSQVKPTSRHAELAVNLAGTMTIFLLKTYKEGKNRQESRPHNTDFALGKSEV